MGGATNLHWSAVSDIPFNIILCLNCPLMISTTLLAMDPSCSNDGLSWQSIIGGRSQGVPGLYSTVCCVCHVTIGHVRILCSRARAAVFFLNDRPIHSSPSE